MYKPFTLKVSNMISATCSLFYGGFRGGQVSTKTVSWGSHRRQSKMLLCQNFYIRSQLRTIPPSIGFTTLMVLYMSLASQPMQKSRVSVIFLLLMVQVALLLWSPLSVMRVGMSKEGSEFPAQPILVQPVPLSMTTTLLLKFIRYLDYYNLLDEQEHQSHLQSYPHLRNITTLQSHLRPRRSPLLSSHPLRLRLVQSRLKDHLHSDYGRRGHQSRSDLRGCLPQIRE